MGCLNSKEKRPSPADTSSPSKYTNLAGDTPPSTPAPKKSYPRPPALDKRKQHMMENTPREILKSRVILNDIQDQVLHRYIGEVNGIDIAVDGIRNSELYVYDITAQVQIDEAHNSTIVIGPCDGSVFIRNCQNSTFFIAASQLRTRDCVNCTIYLYCPTEPVIEMSHGMKIGSWNVAYPGLSRLFEELEFNPLENKCYMIHDFTPNHESLPPVHWEQLSDAEIREASRVIIPEQGEPYDGDEPVNPVPLPGKGADDAAAALHMSDDEAADQEALNNAEPIEEDSIAIEFD